MLGQGRASSNVIHATWLLRASASVLGLCAIIGAVPAAAQTDPAQADPAQADPTKPVAPEDQDSTTAAEETTGITSNPSSPQEETAAPEADAIVVTGIRRSLRSAQDIKRRSDVIVDSVSAEDIGALPDRSVTEALQRIPGVAIDRFNSGRDPDHFSAEGSGVVVRGLTYVRSELNGRDTFSANNGRGLSFADVPAELLGGVDVFKSPSADMIEGGISGIVNLRTRVPFDQARKGWQVAGSAEVNWGDMREKFTPTFALLASNRWDTPIGEIGILGSVAYSELKFRSDGLQISNYGARTLYSDGTRQDVIPFAGATSQGTVFFPRGAVMRSTDTDRKRFGLSGAAQWRSKDDSLLATLQFLRSDAKEFLDEHAVEIATDNVVNPNEGRDSRAVPGTTLEFGDDGLFDNGVITGPTGWRQDQQNTTAWGGNGDVRTPRFGLQSNNIRRQQKNRFLTTDIGANLKWDATDQLTLNFDYQHVRSRTEQLEVGIWTSSFQNVAIDMNGNDLPDVQFLPPEVCSGPATNSPCTDMGFNGFSPQNPSYFGLDQAGNAHNSFADPYNTFWRNVMDHIEDSEGTSNAFRFDADYNFPNNSWLNSVRGGVRHAKRENIARFSAYNWGVLSEIWGGTGNGPVWLSDNVDGVAGGTGGTPTSGAAEPYDFPGFMRGEAGDPLAGDVRLFYSGDPVRDYEQLTEFARAINQEWRGFTGPCFVTASDWGPLHQRCGVVPGTPFLPQEINPIDETNNSAYGMVRFDHEFESGKRLSGNIGLRYSRTKRVAQGTQVFTIRDFDTEEECADPGTNPDTGQPLPPTPFCTLPASVRQEARDFANGAVLDNAAKLTYDYWLPSFNAKLEMGNGVQLRAAFSKSVTPPEFGLTRNYYNLTLGASATDIQAGNGRPVARSTVGNPYLKPIEGTNFDLSAEWYFNPNGVGQLSLALFHKRLKGVLTNGVERLPFTNNGATFDAIVTTPVNAEKTGKVSGFEIAYQQVYDFLPGLLSGFGLNATYTYVKSSGVEQSTLSETDPDVSAGNQSNVDTSKLPLQGLSKHNINFTPFYEKGPLSIRFAYSWRSKFLLTTRDVIVPFAPILNEATGQLDGSIFYSINKNVKVGVQGVNLLNETTRTSQVINNDLLTAPRSWFMNDRRFSGVVRFTF